MFEGWGEFYLLAGSAAGPSTIGSSANGPPPREISGRCYWSKKLRIFRLHSVCRRFFRPGAIAKYVSRNAAQKSNYGLAGNDSEQTKQ